MTKEIDKSFHKIIYHFIRLYKLNLLILHADKTKNNNYSKQHLTHMFTHRSFLMLGPGAGSDIVSLIKGGYEIANCNLTFEQGFDAKGKAQTRVMGGTIHVSLPMLPPIDIIEWGLQGRSYKDGMIVILDNENIPVQKIIFSNTACIRMDVDYTQKGESYTTTTLILQAEKITVGNGVNFENEWIY